MTKENDFKVQLLERIGKTVEDEEKIWDIENFTEDDIARLRFTHVPEKYSDRILKRLEYLQQEKKQKSIYNI